MNTRTVSIFTLFTLFTLLVSACSPLATFGSGDLINQSFEVNGFTGIAVSGAGDLVIIQDGTEAVTVKTDDNLMEYVVADVSGGVLHLRLGDLSNFNLRPTDLVFTVHVKDLASVDTSGSWLVTSEKLSLQDLRINSSGTVEIQFPDLEAADLSVILSGSGKMEAAGGVDSQSITVSGSGKYTAPDLQSATTTIHISGSSNATVWATSSLEVDISGSGQVQYYGSPQTDIQTSGSGSLQRLGDK